MITRSDSEKKRRRNLLCHRGICHIYTHMPKTMHSHLQRVSSRGDWPRERYLREDDKCYDSGGCARYTRCARESAVLIRRRSRSFFAGKGLLTRVACSYREDNSRLKVYTCDDLARVQTTRLQTLKIICTTTVPSYISRAP